MEGARVDPMFGQVGSNCWRSPGPEVPPTPGQSRPLDLFSREEVNICHHHPSLNSCWV